MVNKKILKLQLEVDQPLNLEYIKKEKQKNTME